MNASPSNVIAIHMQTNAAAAAAAHSCSVHKNSIVMRHMNRILTIHQFVIYRIGIVSMTLAALSLTHSHTYCVCATNEFAITPHDICQIDKLMCVCVCACGTRISGSIYIHTIRSSKSFTLPDDLALM